jgi:hypothetical protein
MHTLVSLAQKAIETYILEGKTIKPPDPLPPEMCGKAGVFVSLKKHGELRGCIGTYMPSCDCIANEIIQNAISAATNDPRFRPVQDYELHEITCSVDILTCPERVADPRELDPKKYGIIVVSGFRRGLLLPDLDGVNTVEEQLRITKMKAGILPHEDVELYRFEVIRHR